MADDTFGINSGNTISPEPLNSTQSTTPETPTLTNSSTIQTLGEAKAPEEPKMPDIDKELEKQLESVPATDPSAKKFPVKIIAIIAAIILAGGGTAAYFLLGTDSQTDEAITDEQPPSIANPFAPEDKTTVTEETNTVTPDTVAPEETDIPTPDGPPSLNFPSITPDDAATAESEELEKTVDELKETSDAAANVTDTPIIESAQKIAR